MTCNKCEKEKELEALNESIKTHLNNEDPNASSEVKYYSTITKGNLLIKKEDLEKELSRLKCTC